MASAGVYGLLFLYCGNVLFQISGNYDVSHILCGALLVCAVFCAAKRMHPGWIFAGAGALAVLWGVYSNSVPFSDFANFFTQSARAFSAPASIIKSKSPTTVLLYGTFFSLFGKSLASVYAASALLWFGGGYLGYLALRKAGDTQLNRQVSAAFALSPCILSYTPVISSEASFFLMTCACLYFLVSYLKTLKNIHCILLGVSGALLYFSRGTGAGFFIAACFSILVPGLCHPSEKARKSKSSAKQALIALALVVLSFTSVTAGYGFLHLMSAGRFTMSSNSMGPFLFLVGSNQESSGGFNRDDFHLAGYDTLPREQANRKALEIARQRIFSDPGGFFAFAMTTKIERLWRDQYFAWKWCVAKSPERDKVARMFKNSVVKATNAFYYVILWGFFLWTLRSIFRGGAVDLLVALPVLMIVTLHIFVEVQERYHLAIYPFLVFGAIRFYSGAANALMAGTCGRFFPRVRGAGQGETSGGAVRTKRKDGI